MSYIVPVLQEFKSHHRRPLKSSHGAVCLPARYILFCFLFFFSFFVLVFGSCFSQKEELHVSSSLTGYFLSFVKNSRARCTHMTTEITTYFCESFMEGASSSGFLFIQLE